jgi:hypothetical protein
MWVGRGRYEVESCVRVHLPPASSSSSSSSRRRGSRARVQEQEEEEAVRSQTENAVIMRFS